MNIFLAQQNYTIGDFKENRRKIIHAIEVARSKEADLILFPELAIGGYPPKDLLKSRTFLLKCQAELQYLASYSKEMGILIGAPYKYNFDSEFQPFNSAVLLYQGKIQQVAHQRVAMDSSSFLGSMYFEFPKRWSILDFKGKKVAVVVGDLFLHGEERENFEGWLEGEIPKGKPDLIINLSASPYAYQQSENRVALGCSLASQFSISFIFCNTVGAQAHLIFDGGSFVTSPTGALTTLFSSFQEQISGFKEEELIEIRDQIEDKTEPNSRKRKVGADSSFEPEKNIGQIHEALILGIRDYFKKQGFKEAVLGSSGGLDSAVALALACEALGADHVHAILMPSRYTSTGSLEDATQLSERLHQPFEIISIEPIYQAFLSTLKPQFKELPFNVAEENIQARVRGVLLMALSNKLGYMVLNTSNKSELAVGYGTLYGDMAGGLSLLGDLYKTQVYALAGYINREKEIVPQNILTKPPSAELRPGQKDSESLPDYDLLDPILYSHIEGGEDGQEIAKRYPEFDPEEIKKIIRMVHRNNYKRKQFCPILKVSSRSFGEDWDMPIVQSL